MNNLKIEIRKKRQEGCTLREIGKMFNISHETVRSYTMDIEWKKKKIPRICGVCGARFWVHTLGRDKYCSPKCGLSVVKIPVAMLNDKGEIIKVFNSISDAARKIKTHISVITKASNSKEIYKAYKTARGFMWVRLQDKQNKKNENRNKKKL